MPGLLTSYNEIEIVAPNHRLDVATGEMERCYPAADFRVLELDEIAGKASPALSEQLGRLEMPLVIGLTGGMDSLLTLAASLPVSAKAEYYTYYSPDQERPVALRLGRLETKPPAGSRIAASWSWADRP
ncbi:MAG: hypothetical protein H7288_15765 [Kineosporiaceae bacterium]|nr:hypothetical protein [Aeromicrobium sp.]